MGEGHSLMHSQEAESSSRLVAESRGAKSRPAHVFENTHANIGNVCSV
jgi:hypothetical protein